MTEIRKRATQEDTPRQAENFATGRAEFPVRQKEVHRTLSAEEHLSLETEIVTVLQKGGIPDTHTRNAKATAPEEVMEKAAEEATVQDEIMGKAETATVAEDHLAETSATEKEGRIPMEMTREEVSVKEGHHQGDHSMMAEGEVSTTGEGNSEQLQENQAQDARRTVLRWE